MGIVTPVAMPTYPDGFQDDVVDAFVRATGRGRLWTRPGVGTEMIERLGDGRRPHGRLDATRRPTASSRSRRTRTSCRRLEELYAACRTARGILTSHTPVGRVIARPFTGASGAYRRTANRHDFSLEPPRPNHLSRLREAGHLVHGVGKIGDIFAGVEASTRPRRRRPTSTASRAPSSSCASSTTA